MSLDNLENFNTNNTVEVKQIQENQNKIVAEKRHKAKSVKWTREDDEKLVILVEEQNAKNWKLISNKMNSDKSPLQCLNRWSTILKPGLKKGSWSDLENASLACWIQQEIQKHDIQDVNNHQEFNDLMSKFDFNWKKCSKIVGRSAKQIREHYNNFFNPNLIKTEWLFKEDYIIFNTYNDILKKGTQESKWKTIAAKLPGRTQNSVKNRFYSTLRRFYSMKIQVEDQTNNQTRKLEQNQVLKLYDDLWTVKRIFASTKQNLNLSDLLEVFPIVLDSINRKNLLEQQNSSYLNNNNSNNSFPNNSIINSNANSSDFNLNSIPESIIEESIESDFNITKLNKLNRTKKNQKKNFQKTTVDNKDLVEDSLERFAFTSNENIEKEMKKIESEKKMKNIESLVNIDKSTFSFSLDSNKKCSSKLTTPTSTLCSTPNALSTPTLTQTSTRNSVLTPITEHPSFKQFEDFHLTLQYLTNEMKSTKQMITQGYHFQNMQNKEHQLSMQGVQGHKLSYSTNYTDNTDKSMSNIFNTDEVTSEDWNMCNKQHQQGEHIQQQQQQQKEFDSKVNSLQSCSDLNDLNNFDEENSMTNHYSTYNSYNSYNSFQNSDNLFNSLHSDNLFNTI